MNWLKKNWFWLLVNLLAILPLMIVASLFHFDFSGAGPLISIDMPSRLSEARQAGNILAMEKSALWFPIHTTGEWAVRWLTASLTITPLVILFGLKKIRRYRKLFGLYAFGYALIHFLFFVADKNLMAVFDETGYILGLVSFLIFLPLAITSNKWSMQRLKKTWQALHKWVYLAAILALVHVALLESGSWAVYAVLIGLGFLLRMAPVKNAVLEFKMSRKSGKAARV